MKPHGFFVEQGGKFLLSGKGGETKQRTQVYARHHSESMAECTRT